MIDELNDAASIAHAVRGAFGVKIDVKEVVARAVPVSYTAQATFFLANNNALYVLIRAEGRVVLADVRKMVRGMNLDAADFLPPHGEKGYFERIGEQKFKEVFPGRSVVSPDDLRYYRTLAPYNPALIRIERVKGEIRGFHTPTKTWRKVRDYSYSRISV